MCGASDVGLMYYCLMSASGVGTGEGADTRGNGPNLAYSTGPHCLFIQNITVAAVEEETYALSFQMEIPQICPTIKLHFKAEYL